MMKYISKEKLYELFLKSSHLDEFIKHVKSYELTENNFNNIKIQFHFELDRTFEVPLNNKYYKNIDDKKDDIEKINSVFKMEQSQLDMILGQAIDDIKYCITCRIIIIHKNNRYIKWYKYNSDNFTWDEI